MLRRAFVWISPAVLTLLVPEIGRETFDTLRESAYWGLVQAGCVVWIFTYALVAVVPWRRIAEWHSQRAVSSRSNITPDRELTPIGLSFAARGSAAQYQPGTLVSGIPWRPCFTEMQLDIVNDVAERLTDIDVVVKPDVPIAFVAQSTTLPNVTFELPNGVEMRPEIVNQATGTRFVLPMQVVATSIGYRVRCQDLPSRAHLRLTFALGVMSGKTGPKGVLVHPLNVLTMNFGSESVSYAQTLYSEEIFGPPPTATVVRINGSFVRGGSVETVSASIPVIDFVAQALRNIPAK